MKVTATLTDGRELVVDKFVTYDYIGFERHFGCSVAAMQDASTRRVEHLAFLTWHAAEKRQATFEGGYEAFLGVLEEIEADSEEADGDSPSSDADQPTG